MMKLPEQMNPGNLSKPRTWHMGDAMCMPSFSQPRTVPPNLSITASPQSDDHLFVAQSSVPVPRPENHTHRQL